MESISTTHTPKTVRDQGLANRRAIIAATIGNMLETYDFAVYGFFAIIISRLFFPGNDEVASLLLTVATFGVGFFMRPVGAFVIGSIADRSGRKFALTLTISLMALGTAIIAFLPTYAQIGIWAPTALVAARLIQGFSAGGEVGTATAFLVEHAPAGRRGFFGSFQQASQVCALLLASILGAILTGVLTQDQLEAWGWRIPFLLGILIGPVGLYIRAKIPEAEEFRGSVVRKSSSPVRDAFRLHFRSLLAGFGITITWTVCTYFFLVYMPTYATRQLGLSSSISFTSNTIGLLVLLVLAPTFGTISDRIGRRTLLIGSAMAIAISAYPLLWLLSANPGAQTLILAQVALAVMLAVFTGIAPAAMAEMYPPEVRSSGVSVAYNLAVAVFGGLGPFIATWLIAETANNLAPSFYVIGSIGVSLLLMVFFYPSTRRSDGQSSVRGPAYDAFAGQRTDVSGHGSAESVRKTAHG